MTCDWCHRPLERSEARSKTNHLAFHPACRPLYVVWLKQIQAVCDEEIKKSLKGH
jgi:hypothetical protein